MANKQKSGKKKAVRQPRKQRSNGITGIPKSGAVSRVPRPPSAKKVSHHTAICSISDPFCVHARGAQRPDGGPPSIPFQVRYVGQVGIDGSTGTAKVRCIPGGGFYTTGFMTTVTSKWDGGAAWDAAPNTFVSTYADEVRVVSFGVIVRSAMTATTAKGYVVVSSDPAPRLGAQQAPKGLMNGSDSTILTLAPGMEHAWRSRPLGPAAHMFHPSSKFTSTMTDFDWTSLDIEVVASDTTTGIVYVTIEYILNLEMTMRATSGTGGTNPATLGVTQLHKNPPVPNQFALKAADAFHQNAPTFIEGGLTKVSNALGRYAQQAMDSVMSEGLALLAL